MKYMGSKRMMLANGLGELLSLEVSSAPRFVDLFAGSGAVAIHVAGRYAVRVLAFDLQSYSALLARAVIGRRTKLDQETIWKAWLRRAHSRLGARTVPVVSKLTRAVVEECRSWCANQTALPITRAYGGHYFSPSQSSWLDALRATLPLNEPDRTVALAAVIRAGSQCAAAPGHTAQPFQPTRTAKPYLEDAWSRDAMQRTKDAFALLADQVALRPGRSEVGDANEAAKELREGDTAFIDPPYSSVHYSRFYHVLETIALGESVDVSGVGRYPPYETRPRSKYSLRTESASALDDLLNTVATRGARAILTFPDHDCSNGLSGQSVREIARKYFIVREQVVESKFSTLGGTGAERENKAGRAPRQKAQELILILKPR
jgi:adenine-specific DNA-methyltransferase